MGEQIIMLTPRFLLICVVWALALVIVIVSGISTVGIANSTGSGTLVASGIGFLGIMIPAIVGAEALQYVNAQEE